MFAQDDNDDYAYPTSNLLCYQ